MAWLGLGLGEFGSQLGQAKEISQNWRLRQQQMALEQARQKMEESLMPLRMAEIDEIKQRIARGNLPQVAWHELPGGGFGYTMAKPGEEPGPLRTLQKGIPEYRNQRVRADGKLVGTNSLTNREEIVPGSENMEFPVPGAKPRQVSTYDPNGDLRYVLLDEKEQVTAWGPLVPETQAFRTEVTPEGATQSFPVPRHIRMTAPANQTPEAQLQWQQQFARKPGIAKTPPRPTAKPSAAAAPSAAGPAGLSDLIKKTFDTTKLVPQPGQAPSSAGAETPAPERPSFKPTRPGAVITKVPLLTAEQKKTAETIDVAMPMINSVLGLMVANDWQKKNSVMDALKERGKWAVYGFGKAQGNPYDRIAQVTSLLRVMIATPYMRGMRNIQWVTQIQQHLPDPSKDTPAFMYEKMNTLVPILDNMRKVSSQPILPTPPTPAVP